MTYDILSVNRKVEKLTDLPEGSYESGGIAYMSYTADGTRRLDLFHLSDRQLEILEEIMIFNGVGIVYDVRAEAMAHADRFDKIARQVVIYIHRDDIASLTAFTTMLSVKTGMYVPRMPDAVFAITG